MGKGDRKTRKGKIILGTYGKLRPKRRKFRVKPGNIQGAISKK